MMHEEVCMHAFVKSLLCVLLAPAEKSWAPEIVYTAVFNCEPVIGKEVPRAFFCVFKVLYLVSFHALLFNVS